MAAPSHIKVGTSNIGLEISSVVSLYTQLLNSTRTANLHLQGWVGSSPNVDYTSLAAEMGLTTAQVTTIVNLMTGLQTVIDVPGGQTLITILG